MATYNGTSGNDFLRGSTGDDIMNGLGGDDQIFGAAGNDQIYGGDGDDFLRGDDGDDQIFGGAGNEFMRGGKGVDTFDGGSEDTDVTAFGASSHGDRISFFEQTATSGVIADLRTGVIENDGFGNRETMISIESLGGATAFVDYFYGNDAANLLIAGAGDTMMGFGGNDHFQVGGAAALLDGGVGSDFALFLTFGDLVPDTNGDGIAETGPDMTSGWMIDLALESMIDGFGGAGVIRSIERVHASGLNDTLRGTEGAEQLLGSAGDDVLEGRGGNDLINAQSGSDTADGGTGIDTLAYNDFTFRYEAFGYQYGDGAVHVDLEQGFAEEAEANKIVVEGPDRIEVYVGSGTIQDDTPRVARDEVAGFENIIGTGLGDRLYGNGSDNVIAPGAGDNIVDGRGGTDTIDYSIARGEVTVNLAQGSAVQAASGAAPLMFFTQGGTGPSGQLENVVQADDNRVSTDQLLSIENVIGSELSDSITGDAFANLLEGRSGNDTLRGGAGSDVLSGGLGFDTLFGDAGSDIFRDTITGLNGDSIGDFATEDRIVLSDANLQGFTVSKVGNTISFTGGSVTLATAIEGRVVASAAAGGGVEIRVEAATAVRNDYNGDGRSDILWRNDNGTVTDWLGTATGGFEGNFANANLALANDWQVAGTGDFNGDGRSDILWRNDNGTVTDWLGQANGGFAGNFANANLALANDWQVAGTGDFNGDGRDDILWRNANGTVTDWLGTANGGFEGNFANANLALGNDWQIAGTGDFNGDGRDDILWRNDNGTVTDWLGTANGGFEGNFANANLALGNDWQIAGTGDFNGDGRDDILWRNDNGTVTDWLGTANGGFTGNFANANLALGNDWQIAGTGDFNGDGRDDILWRNANGTVTDWLGTANGGFDGNFANANLALGNDWQIQPSGDLF